MRFARRPVLPTALAVSVLTLASAAPAAGQVRVAVVPFDGSGANGARRQVQSALEDDSRVDPLSLDRVNDAAERAGAGSEGSEGIAELARDLSVQMVIQGRVTGRGRRRRVRLTARDAQGAQIATAGGAMRGGGLGHAVESLLDEALPRLRSAATASATSSTGRATRAIASDEEPLEDESDEDEGGEDESDEDGEGPGWQRGTPMLSIQIGVLPRSREADVTFEDTRHGRYSAWYLELGVRAEVRPLARDASLGRALYGRLQFAHAVGLTSRIDSTGQPVDTAFYRLDFAIGALFPLADAFDLGAELGAGWDTYNLADNPLLESVEYVYIRPALRARAQLYREIVVLSAEVGIRPAFSRGDFNQYGSGGDTFGFDVGGGIGGGYLLAGDVGISYGVELAWVSYWMSFSGGMGATAGRSGTDSSLRIGIWAGVALW